MSRRQKEGNALDQAAGNLARAAKLPRVTRVQLTYRLKKNPAKWSINEINHFQDPAKLRNSLRWDASVAKQPRIKLLIICAPSSCTPRHCMHM